MSIRTCDCEIVIEDERWTRLDLESLCAAAIGRTLTDLGIDPADCALTLLACDDARIAALNEDFRGKARPTNVLSWPAEERGAATPGGTPRAPQKDAFGTLELGDIALSYDTCVAEARSAGKPLGDHVTHLVVHGLLHLLGYDHETEADAALMEGWEVKVLGKLGLDDPYRDTKAP